MPAQAKRDAVRPRSDNVGLDWIDLPPDGNNKPIPGVPYSENHSIWTEYGKSMWLRLWTSPESTQWNRTTDLESVYRYVELHEKAAHTGEWTGPMLTAVMQISDKLGLNPAAKRRMYWRIKPVDETPTMSHLAPVTAIQKEELR